MNKVLTKRDNKVKADIKVSFAFAGLQSMLEKVKKHVLAVGRKRVFNKVNFSFQGLILVHACEARQPVAFVF